MRTQAPLLSTSTSPPTTPAGAGISVVPGEVVVRSPHEEGIVVVRSRWNLLRSRVERSKTRVDHLWAAGWALVAAAFTSLAVLSTLPSGTSFSYLATWGALSGIFGISGTVTLVYAWRGVKHSKGMLDVVIEDMDDISR